MCTRGTASALWEPALVTMKIYSRAVFQVNDRKTVTFKILSTLHQVTGQFEFVEGHVVD